MGNEIILWSKGPKINTEMNKFILKKQNELPPNWHIEDKNGRDLVSHENRKEEEIQSPVNFVNFYLKENEPIWFLQVSGLLCR